MRHSAPEEQAGVDPSDAEAAREPAAGNAAYEARFDRVFLIGPRAGTARRSSPSSGVASTTTTTPSVPRP